MATHILRAHQDPLWF